MEEEETVAAVPIEGVEINSLGGYCPCQGEGTVDGLPFYFRARHEHWQLWIADEPGADPLDVTWEGAAGWYTCEEWGDGPYMAGYMEPDQAVEILRTEFARYRAERDGIADGGDQ